MPIPIKIIMALVLSAIAFPIYAGSQRFTVVSNGVIFALGEPSGWQMDTNNTKNNGLPVVYYPSDQTWGNAPAVMYANSALHDCDTGFEKFINNDLAEFKSNSPAITIVEGEDMTVDGKKVTVKYFSGDKYGNSEAVAYLDNKDGVFISIKLPPAKLEVYCLSASKALVTQEPPEGGYSHNFIWS